LTFHERANQLICHHCNRRYPIPEICPSCNSKRIRYFGSGTQRIEDLVHEFVPEARVMRWDADTARSRGGHEAILHNFANHQADVLVGTQMIAKGLDLPLVTLVGVVAADVGLYLPDFRSGERSFQLLTQVAGRAGRSRHGGRVVIQSYTPDHYVIQAAAQHDYIGFYQREVGYREEYGYPPLRRMARLVYWDKKLDKAKAAAEEMTAMVRARLQELGLGPNDARLIGPAPAFFARFRSYYRWQLLLITDDPALVLRQLTIPFGWRVDVDPVSVL
jgi:primosomal protein N' (replication factor Y)